MPIVFKMNEHEQHMLQSLHRPTWSTGFEIPSFQKNDKKNLTATAENYRKSILEEATMKKSDYELWHVGKVDPKQFIKENADSMSAHEAALLARLHVTNSSF